MSENKPYLIGICGGSASGKTSAADLIINYLGQENCLLFSLDNYYFGPNDEERKHIQDYNFDRPEALDLDLAYHHLTQLINNEPIDMPVYSFNVSKRMPYTKKVYPKKIIIFEGIFSLYEKRMRDLMDLKLFFDLDSDIRLFRRISRDISDRSRVLETVLDRYLTFVKPAFDIYIKPTRNYVELVSPQGTYNSLLVEIVSEYIINKILHKDKINKSDNSEIIKQTLKLIEFKGTDFFEKPKTENVTMVENEKERIKFNKVIYYLITKTNTAFYEIYNKALVETLLKMTKENNTKKIKSVYLTENNFLDFKKINAEKKENNENELIVYIFAPILLSKKIKIKDELENMINEIKNDKIKFVILSVFLSERTYLNLEENIKGLNYITIYYGNKLLNFKDILKGGGTTVSNSIDLGGTVKYITSENLIEEYQKKIINEK